MFTLLHGKDKSSLNLFIDKSNDNAFYASILDDLRLSLEHVIMFCYRYPATMYKNKFAGESSRFSYFDHFSDPLHWFAKSNEPELTKNELHDNLHSSLNELKENTKVKDVIVIDDLLLFGRSTKCIDNMGLWEGLLELLQDMTLNNYLFVFVNGNLLSDGNLRSLLHISPFYVTVNVDYNRRTSFSCQSILRKPSGKVIVNNITVMLDEQGMVTSVKDEKYIESKEVTKDVDPTSNLTFNLRLTDDEKQARANTMLPYILTESSKSAYLDNSPNVVGPGGGDVLYMPDDADDFDDEDPDDDLDF